MFKFMLIFYHPEDIVAFENRYQDLLALVERMPEIIRRQVIHVTGSPSGRSPYYRILEVYYIDQEAMNRSLLSPAGQEAGGEIQKFAANAFEMAFAEVYEEAGGATPPAS
jgi:uncharacterized protein (TIGR02118 family)